MNTKIKEIATLLDGIEYRSTYPKEVLEQLDGNILIVTGNSDDIVRIAGPKQNDDDEFCEGRRILFRRKGEVLTVEMDLYEFNDDLTRFDGVYKKFDEDSLIESIGDELDDEKNYIIGNFGDDGFEFETDMSHERFRVMEDGEIYCYGLVIGLE